MWLLRKKPQNEIRSSQPYWLMRNGIGDARGHRGIEPEQDVVIVGAGITGALVADALVATGRRILILDAHEPGLGSTSASTALLQYEIDTHLADLAQMIGAGRATLAYRACVDSFSQLERRFPDLLAGANYERRESLYVASNEAAVPKLRIELAARTSIGIACDWIEGPELARRFGIRRPAALLSALGAQIDPLRLTRGLLAGCERHGVGIRARESVEAIAEEGERLRVTLKSGASLLARDVVVCAGYDSLRFLPEGVADVHNTFALVTQPLPASARVAAQPLIWESARPYLYIRGTPDGRLIVGGADLPFKSATARDLLLPRQVGRLAASYRDLFGAELPPVAHAWAGSFAETRDGLPYIGRVPGLSPHLQFALCFGGNGITYSVQAGDIIRAGIEGRTHDLDEVFGFTRFDGIGTIELRNRK